MQRQAGWALLVSLQRVCCAEGSRALLTGGRTLRGDLEALQACPWGWGHGSHIWMPAQWGISGPSPCTPSQLQGAVLPGPASGPGSASAVLPPGKRSPLASWEFVWREGRDTDLTHLCSEEQGLGRHSHDLHL